MRAKYNTLIIPYYISEVPLYCVLKREDMKILISDFEKQIPTIRANLVGAIKRGNINGWKE